MTFYANADLHKLSSYYKLRWKLLYLLRAYEVYCIDKSPVFYWITVTQKRFSPAADDSHPPKKKKQQMSMTSDGSALGSVEYLFIAITSRFTLTRSDINQGSIYGSSKSV